MGTSLAGKGKEKTSRKRSSGIFPYIAALLLVLLVTSGLLAWQGYVAYRNFVHYQNETGKQAVQGGIKQLTQLLVDLRTKVNLLVYSYGDQINEVAEAPHSQAHYEALAAHVKQYFPGHFSYTLIDVSGRKLYHDDLGERIGDLCRNDITAFSQAGFKQRVHIHPGPLRYHIDIMVGIRQGVNDEGHIFFVSLLPDMLATLLANSQVVGHELFLVREDQPELIEVAAAGVRNKLSRETRLDQSEIERLAYSQPVPESRWLLVSLPSLNLFNAERNRLIRNGVIIELVIAAITIFSLVLIARSRRARTRLDTRYKNLIDSVQAVFWQAELQPLKIDFISQRVEPMLGFQPEEFINEPELFLRLIDENDRVDVRQKLEHAIDSDTYVDIEYRMRRKDQGWMWIRNIFGVHAGQEGGTRVEGIIIDISEQRKLQQDLLKRSEELAVALDELESFSYSVSHDLRGPLRAIDGFACALEEEYVNVLDDTGRDYLARVRTASQRMGMLIDDLLALAQVSRTNLTMEQVDISAMAQELLAMITVGSPQRKVECVVEPGIMVRGDAVLLRMVLQNLLENAWKFTSRTANPRIEVGSHDAAGGRCCFVRDNGIGFSMKYVNQLFVPFQRLHSMEEYPGTGIGLATVQRILNRHGGEVYAEGEEGVGATFYFCLPE